MLNQIAAIHGTGAAAPVSPPISGYKLWLDASDTSTITQSGGAVSQWTDKSVNGYTFTQATAGNKPTTGTRTQNGLNVLDLDGGDLLTSSAAASTWTFLSNNTQWTAFYAFKTDISSFSTIFATAAAQSSRVGTTVYLNSPSAYSLGHETANGTEGSASLTNTSALNSIDANFTYITLLSDANNATAANRSDLRVKQGSAIKNNVKTTATNNGTPTYTLEIGMASNLGAYGLDGMLGEILIYTSTLSSGDILSTQEYLASKWGV